jgi:hypothetical protein
VKYSTGDARDCACGIFYRVTRGTVPVKYSTGRRKGLCLWDILQDDARNCACGIFYRVIIGTVPVGFSTG